MCYIDEESGVQLEREVKLFSELSLNAFWHNRVSRAKMYYVD
jgi:hypothetical protein